MIASRSSRTICSRRSSTPVLRASMLPTSCRRAAKALRESGDRAWSIGALNAALGFYTRLRELDPSVEDDPYFLLSLGLALAMGTFEEAGASELERAAQALQESDPAAAAQATITRGEFVWQRGDQDGAFAYFDRARALAENAPLSPQKLYVVSQVSRFLALAGRYEEARGEVEQAIAMAEELGDDELLGDSLNNRAVVYASLGDPRWEEDSTRSIEIALRTNSFRATRAYINYGSHLVDTAADLARAEAVTREGLALGRKLGLGSTAMRWILTNLAEMIYLAGSWEEALELAEQEIASGPHYVRQVAYGVRAGIRLSRGDDRGAAEDAEIALREARAIRDPQALDPALVTAAAVASRAGDTTRANALLDELGATERAAGSWVVQAAWLCHDLGRPRPWSGRGDATRTPWTEAGDAIAESDLARAADILEPTGARTFVAAVRLRAAQKAAVEGRAREASEQLAPAMAFYREVGASAIHPRGRSAARRRRAESAAAASELDRRLARGDPGVDSAVPDGVGVEAVRCEDARRDRGARAGLADGDDRPVPRKVGLTEREQAVRDVAAPRDVAGVALVLLAHVDELRACLEERVELFDRDEVERLRTAAEDVALDLEMADRVEAAHRAVRPRPRPGPTRRRGLASTTNAAFVEKRVPETGTLNAPATWPAANASTGRTSSTCTPSGAAASSDGICCAPTNGPRLSSTIRSMFGGRGVETPADSATNTATSS